MVDRGLFLLTAGVGCLTGDTEVGVNRRRKGYRLRLDTLVHRWNDGSEGGRGTRMRYDDGDTRVRGLRVDGQIGLVPLIGVLDSGVMPVMRLWLSDGRDVTLTYQHEVVTPDGKVTAASLLPGSAVLVDSWRGRPEHWGEHRQRTREFHHGTRLPDGRYMDKDGYILVWGTRKGPKKWMYEHRVVMEAMLGRELLSSEHVHHINHRSTDNRPENLRLLPHGAHATHHADRANMPGAIPDVVTVLRVEDGGQQHVYDLSVDEEAHTWIGNGVVVGNTGKTPMTIAAIEELREEFGDGFCGQVVCAGGLKQQWADQIAQFTGGVEDNNGHWTGGAACLVIDGPPTKRLALYARALAEKPQYVIVGYDQVIDDNNHVVALPQMFVVADEVTTIKTPGALITQAFRATYSEAPFRYGLTGTPMENGKPEEMFQIMVWIDDTVLGRADLFDATFVKRNKWGGVREYLNLPLFHEMMLECSVSIDPDDDDVAPYMPTMRPPKRVLVQLDVESARLYRRMSADLQQELADAARLSKGGSFDLFAHYAGDSAAGETQGKIMSKISCIRMLCAHPDQLINSAEEYTIQLAKREADPDAWPMVTKTLGGKKVKVPKPFSGSAYAAQLLDEGQLDALDETPKIDEACEDIDRVLAGTCPCEVCVDREGAAELNKLVVFSYHKLSLRILEARYGKTLAVRYDGDMSLKVRNENKKRFQRDPATRLFFTSDAGGYGVDLPQANHLYNLDVPFTAGRVTQRNARVRRANLDFHDAVHVRNYLIDASLEVYYANATAVKQKVVTAVRTGKGTTKGGLKMNAASLAAFLRDHDDLV